jgi:DNA-binding MarR family transcriptional regulator
VGERSQSRRNEGRERSVGYTLSQVGFETSRRFGEIVGGLGLEPRQYALLNVVGQREGQSQQAIAEELRIPASTMVSVVDALEEAGLVARRLHPSDRRTRTLHLTPAGADALEKATALAWTWEEVICGGFTERERRQLLTLLGRVAANIGVELGALPDRGSGERPPHLPTTGSETATPAH